MSLFQLIISTKSGLDFLNENTTLLFLPGDYTLKSKISITDVRNFSMISISPDNVSIFCHQNASFKFEGTNKLTIKEFMLLIVATIALNW